nr:NADH dehydrogenase subunit 2 [Neoheterobothrium hirame]
MIYSQILWFVSVLFSLGALFTNNIVLLIFFLEMVSLVAVGVCCYSSSISLYKGFNSLITLFIISSISGLFLLVGWLLSLNNCFFLGLCIKLGIFPFCWWVYNVYSGVSWEGIVFLNTLFKIPIVLIALVLNINENSYNYILFSFTVLLCSLYLLSKGSSWYVFIGGNSIISSYVLYIVLSYLDYSLIVSLLLLGWVYFFFFILFVFNTSNSDFIGDSINAINTFWFIFILLSIPASLSVFYKIFTVYCLTVNDGFVYTLLLWCFYQVVEQLWLVNLLFLNSDIGTKSEDNTSRLL